MESVYFGKESSAYDTAGNGSAIFGGDKDPLPLEGPFRYYYFPDENCGKLRIVALLSSLFISAIIELIIFVFILPVYQVNSYGVLPYSDLLTAPIYMVSVVVFIGSLLCFLLYAIIHNLFRKKVYVRDGRTIRVVKMKVRVKTHKKGVFSTKEEADKRIHEKYSGYIRKIDDLIATDSRKIKKTYTGCIESDNLGDNGKRYSGYNEKKMTDEEFSIPSHYMLYEAHSSYYKGNAISKLLFVLIKIAVIGLLLFYIYSYVKCRLNVYDEKFTQYLDSKISILKPLGLEYSKDHTGYEHSYDFIEFIDTADDYLNNQTRIYFRITDSEIKDYNISIIYDLYYEDDPKILNRIVSELYDGNTPDLSIIEDAINEYMEKPGVDVTRTEFTDDTYFNIFVQESDWADYYVYIYVAPLHHDDPLWYL